MNNQQEMVSDQPTGFKNSRVFIPLIVVVMIFIVSIIINLYNQTAFSTVWLLNIILASIGIVLMLWISQLIKEDLCIPFIYIRNWSLRLIEKDYTARIPIGKKSEFSKLAKDLNNMSDILQFFSDEFQDKVDQQTSIIKDQDDSLNILYEVATTINESQNIDQLLSSFLKILTKLTSAHAATVRLISDDNKLKMVASVGLSKNFVKEECIVPIDRCLCGNTYLSGKTGQSETLQKCSKLNQSQLLYNKQIQNNQIGIISVPIEYQGVHLGIYNLFIEKKFINVEHKEHEGLLVTIGKHLGMAFEKFRLTDEAKQHSIIKERTLLAHELHDSLAQTLASLRFQVTIIEENLHEKIPVKHPELENLHESIDEAYAEVRGLISHFRAPLDHHGLIPAIDKIITNFKNTCNMIVFFQNEWKDQPIKSEHEYQIIRIIQESLNNIKKHSQARTVRLMIKTHATYNEVLIEDDGIGINNSKVELTSLGEHIGLSVMKERAQRTGGNLNIESEVGEGTQILLNFPTATSLEQPINFITS